MGVWLLVYWCIGVLVYWCIGVLVYWCIGVLVYWLWCFMFLPRLSHLRKVVMPQDKYPAQRLLDQLEEAYAKHRQKVTPLYPLEAETGAIRLPKQVDKALCQLLRAGKKAEAVKRVAELTGGGLRVSKDYVDALAVRYKIV